MEAINKQKIANAVYALIDYATRAFLTVMAAICALMTLTCLLYVFKDPVMSIFGGIGFGGAAVGLWEARKSIRS